MSEVEKSATEVATEVDNNVEAEVSKTPCDGRIVIYCSLPQNCRWSKSAAKAR